MIFPGQVNGMLHKDYKKMIISIDLTTTISRKLNTLQYGLFSKIY